MSRRRLTGFLGIAAFLTAVGCGSYGQPESAETQLAFGSNVAKKGLWREAAFRFQQAVTKEPNNARARNNLAVALEASGDYARALAARFNGANVVGVDVSEAMLQEARKHAPELTFVVGDAAHLPFDDQSFDVAAHK